MTGKKKNLSEVEALPSAAGLNFGVVVSEWNGEITEKLKEGCIKTLTEAGAPEDQIKVITVPGSFELPFGAKLLLGESSPDAIICLGCVIKGETKHDEYINHAISQGLIQLSLFANVPIIFGVLTPNTYEQALDRAGGAHGNKGVESAVTAIRMATLKKEIRDTKKKIGFS